MRRIILLIIMAICYCPVCAQDTAAIAKVMQLVRQVQDRIITVPTSYYILYTYANEHTPAILLDSMRGTVEIDGTNYHSILDSTETIHNSKYNIVLFKEDKVMYLASSTPGEVSTNPMQQMLAFLDSAHNSTCLFSRNKSQVKVFINFPSGGT
ncbi:hypothetical protein, partial [[Flexibacter] sp. ATCC 35208]|uniref:hypothetical protein n=1 Tax=[Flexibacter] sp. ATCC 35208 TaxID=1936242 RepID=UPI00117F00B1